MQPDHNNRKAKTVPEPSTFFAAGYGNSQDSDGEGQLLFSFLTYFIMILQYLWIHVVVIVLPIDSLLADRLPSPESFWDIPGLTARMSPQFRFHYSLFLRGLINLAVNLQDTAVISLIKVERPSFWQKRSDQTIVDPSYRNYLNS